MLGDGWSPSMPSSASDSSPSQDMGRGAEAAAVPLALAVARILTIWVSSDSNSSSSSICSILGTVMRTAPVAVVSSDGWWLELLLGG